MSETITAPICYYCKKEPSTDIVYDVPTQTEVPVCASCLGPRYEAAQEAKKRRVRQQNFKRGVAMSVIGIAFILFGISVGGVYAVFGFIFGVAFFGVGAIRMFRSLDKPVVLTPAPTATAGSN
jgi:hypothetical protein